MGNVRNRGRKSARKVLTPEEAEKIEREESRNCWHSIIEKILPIPAQLENTILDTPEEES